MTHRRDALAMKRCVVLVRGVNVGGHNRLPMAELRRLLTGLGGADVTTYLQSGNAVVSWYDSPLALQEQVAAALHDELTLAVAVMVRTAAELDAVVADNPFPDPDPKHFHVGFLSGEPDADRIAAIDNEALLPDRLAFSRGVAYLAYADVSRGSALSRLRLGVEMTARNWRTVTALQGLCRDGAHGTDG